MKWGDKLDDGLSKLWITNSDVGVAHIDPCVDVVQEWNTEQQ